jgi:hypothetical protein
MNAFHESSRDDADDALDRAIGAVTAQPSPPHVKDRVLGAAAAFTPRLCRRLRPAQRRFWRVVAASVATIAAASLLALLMLPSASVGWADVTRAVQSQDWIRATAASAENKEDKHGTIWLSPQRQLWAFHTDNWFLFFDGRRQEQYEYHAGEKRIVKTPLREDDAQRTRPIDYLSRGCWLFGTENVVSRQRREVREAGKKWIEFEIVFFRGGDVGTLRVDPETRLPASLATKAEKWTFDYPADGPADIYALGVPAAITIDDRMPSQDCLRVLRAMAASRARIGDFRLVVLVDPPNHGVSSIVWRKGDRWRIDMCWWKEELPGARRGAMPPDGLGWGDPLAEQLKLSWLGRNLACDGRTVYKNARRGAKGAPAVQWQAAPQLAPQALLSGEGFGYIDLAPYAKIASLLYPDLSPRPGWGFEFDPRPADAPTCVLIKRSARLAVKEPTVGHEWYYIDPAKGYAVVRAELFNLPAGAPAGPEPPADRTSIRMEDFHQSPQGFLYPRLIHDSGPVSGPNQKIGSEAQTNGSTAHYHFDFDVLLPDSLFAVDGASEPKE